MRFLVGFALVLTCLSPGLPSLGVRLAPLGSRLSAQTIGALPDKSPFVDLTDHQRIGVTAGYLVTGHDPVGVNPKSAPFMGLRYDLYAGGPVYLTARFFAAPSERDVLDYTKSAATRRVGTQSSTIFGTDVGIAVSMTGDRSWHAIQPLLHLGFGLAGGIGDKIDVSHFSFSPTFAFSYGLGGRWVTGRNSELRADVNWYYWQVKYPDLYRSTQGDPIAIRPTGSMSPYTGNRAMTVSWTMGIFR
ncbi:MAG: hypothetical protein ACHQQ3_03315 [Gemmatimonadales bacterium]